MTSSKSTHPSLDEIRDLMRGMFGDWTYFRCVAHWKRFLFREMARTGRDCLACMTAFLDRTESPQDRLWVITAYCEIMDECNCDERYLGIERGDLSRFEVGAEP